LKIETVKRVESITAILLSAVVLFLLIARATHGGGLWRDEADSVQLAQMGTWGEMWGRMRFSSFPILFPALVRAHIALFGASNNALRWFGLIMGVAFVGIAWWYSRTLFTEAPLLLLALIGLNTTFLTVGTSLRGYGLGSVFMLLAFALTAKLLLEPTHGRFAAVFLAYLAGMQCLFFDGVLAPAMALAAVILCVSRGRFKLALALAGAVTGCAIAYIPHVKMLPPVKDWGSSVEGSQISLELMWKQFIAACGAPFWIMSYVWHIVFLVSVIAAIWRLKVIWRQQPGFESNLLLFGLLTSLISIVGYGAFLNVLHKPPSPRYYLPLICLIAVSVDLIVANLSRFLWVRITRVIFVIALVIFLPWAAWPRIILRETNIDIIAHKLEREARPNDLIIVNPWSPGISFNWYYHGATRWITLPNISDHMIHRYDLIKEKMMNPFPLEDVKSETATTLHSGNRVWVVGTLHVANSPGIPLFPFPAPDPEFGWQHLIYRDAWSRQFRNFVARRAVKADCLIKRTPNVNPQENVALWLVEGERR